MEKKNNNPFTMRKEIMLIEYEDVIKCPSAGILNLIKKDYMDELKDLINVSKLKLMDFNNIQRYSIERPTRNILDYIKVNQFNTETIYNALYNAYDTIYMDLPLMSIGDSVYFISKQKFTEKIYIFSEKYDKKIEFDIKENYCELDNVFYVAGDFKSIINNIEKPTSYILSDIDKVQTIIDENMIEFVEIMVAQYGYNYCIDDSILKIRGDYDKMMYDKNFKIASFTPLKMDNSYYTI